jgi:very-short-patch-repair endonuclease
MTGIHNKNLVSYAKELRKNMTKEEKHLWYDFLRDYDVKFLRQKIIGKYIVDFYCARAKLVIELDGSQHYEEAGITNDEARTEYLKQFGISVLRIPNNAVNENFSGVCEYIDEIVRQSPSHLR